MLRMCPGSPLSFHADSGESPAAGKLRREKLPFPPMEKSRNAMLDSLDRFQWKKFKECREKYMTKTF